MSERQQRDKDIEMLLNAAGARAVPDEGMRQRTYDNVLAAWQELPEDASSTAPGRPTRWQQLAVAASVLVIIGAAMLTWNNALVAPGAIAQVAYATGSYLADGEPTQGSVELSIGQVIQTTSHPLTVRTFDGASITLAEHTRLQLHGNGSVRLETGHIYVDAEDTDARLSIITPTSSVTDIGTQFDVRVQGEHGERLDTAVRRGTIGIVSGTARLVVQAEQGIGRLLRLDNGALASNEPLAASDPYWDWRRAARPPYPLAGSSVFDYLQWTARDRGHDLVFRRRVVEQTARLERFLGSDERNADQISVREALETTTLRLVDASAPVWEVDLRE